MPPTPLTVKSGGRFPLRSSPSASIPSNFDNLASLPADRLQLFANRSSGLARDSSSSLEDLVSWIPFVLTANSRIIAECTEQGASFGLAWRATSELAFFSQMFVFARLKGHFRDGTVVTCVTKNCCSSSNANRVQAPSADLIRCEITIFISATQGSAF